MIIDKVSTSEIENGEVDILNLEGGAHIGYVLFTRLNSENNMGELKLLIEDHDISSIDIADLGNLKARKNRELPSSLSGMSITIGLLYLHGDAEDENALIRVKPKDGSNQFSYNDMVGLENLMDIITESGLVEVGGEIIRFK